MWQDELSEFILLPTGSQVLESDNLNAKKRTKEASEALVNLLKKGVNCMTEEAYPRQPPQRLILPFCFEEAD